MNRILCMLAGIFLVGTMACKPQLSKNASAQTPKLAKKVKPLGKANKQKVLPKKRRTPPPSNLCRIKQHTWSWYEKAELLTDRHSLAKMYRRNRYRIPHKTRTMMLATRVLKGVGQPAFQIYSLYNTGFRYSRGKRRWWPASCVKPWAIVGALMTLHRYGLTGKTHLTFRDRYGRFSGKFNKLYSNITNQRYDRMMTIAGVDTLNDTWRKRYQYPNLILQRAYGGMRTLRRSPKIYYRDKGKKGIIPKHYSKKRFKRCNSNCTTLFELQDVLRRTILHNELPKKERFLISSDDVRRLKRVYLKIPNKMGRAFRRVWGRKSKGYNKSGSAKGWDQIENVFIEPQHSKYRYLIAGSVPWWRQHYMATPSLKKLNELGRQTMLALNKLTADRVSLQTNAGIELKVQITTKTKMSRRFKIRIKGKGIKKIKIWNRTKLLPSTKAKDGSFSAFVSFSKAGKQLLVIQGYKENKAISYRAVGLFLPPLSQALSCKK